jgi:hypothetical protein
VYWGSQFTQFVSGTLTASGDVARRLSRTLGGGVGFAGNLSRSIHKRVSGVLASAGSLFALVPTIKGGTIQIVQLILKRAHDDEESILLALHLALMRFMRRRR